MGYRAKKEAVEKKIKKAKIILLCCICLLFVALIILSIWIPSSKWKYHISLPKIDARKDGQMRIHYIDVGQGDATLIQLPDGKTMLIDGGDDAEEHTTALLRYINALKIDVIDYLVVTHADDDHCGGLKKVLEYKAIKNAYLPMINEDEQEQLTAYRAFFNALQNENCTQSFSSAAVNLSVNVGETPYSLVFLYPNTLHLEETLSSNDSSAVIWLDYKGTSAIFMGDVSKEVAATFPIIDEYLNEGAFNLSSTEIYKVPHHGSKSSHSQTLVEYLHAKTAVISCGKDNIYNHPSLEVSNSLLALQIETYRTDLLGNVIITIETDGTYTVKTLKNR